MKDRSKSSGSRLGRLKLYCELEEGPLNSVVVDIYT